MVLTCGVPGGWLDSVVPFAALRGVDSEPSIHVARLKTAAPTPIAAAEQYSDQACR